MASAAKLQEFRGPKLGDAASLWNFAPAPGWTDEEVSIFKLCLQKYGVGSWQAIQRTGLLPGKLVQQMVGQAQRILGQQSLSAFTGLQLDVDRIRQDNALRTDVQRKAGLIIYTGPTATSEMKEAWRRDMQARYGLSAITLREVAAALEELAAQRMTHIGGEGLQGPAARAALQDALECDASQLPPDLAAQLVRRLHSKLGVLVDRLRARLGLPVAGKRALEQAAAGSIQEHEVETDEPEGCGENATSRPQDPGAPGAKSGKPPRASGGRGSRGGRGRKPKTCGLLRAAQGPGVKAEKAKASGSAAAARPAGKRGRAAGSQGVDSSPESSCAEELSDAGQAAQEPGRRPKRTSAQVAMEVAMESDIVSLQAMGFSRAKAKAALTEVGGSVEDALDWLLHSCT